MIWTNEEKIKLTDWINDNYFDNKNFGAVSKAEFELFLFSMYYDHLIDSGEKCDDYIMGKQLGITINRIRNLKEKKELKYHRDDYYWVASFIKCIENARYDETTHLVKVNIPDVNVIKDVRYFLEQNGWYDEYQLNPKLFQCRADIFVEMCNCLPDREGMTESYNITTEAKERLREISHSASNDKEKTIIEKIIDGNVKEGLKELAHEASKELFSAVLSEIPFGGVAQSAINLVIKAIKGN